MNTVDIFQSLYSNDIAGRVIDKGILVFLGNALSDLPVMPIKLNKIEQVAHMIPDSDSSFTFINGGSLYWCAYYDYSTEFPIGRLYFVSEVNIFNWGTHDNNLKKLGFKLNLIKHDKFSQIIGESGAITRIENYKFQKDKENMVYKGLVDGRINSTTINQGIYIKTKGCVVCGEITDKLINCNLANEDDGLMIGYHLCKDHYAESLKYDSSMDYYCEKFNVPKLYKTDSLTQDDIIFSSILILKCKLECKIDKVEKNTITAFRIISGYKLVLRLDSVSNYGYMIFNSEHQQLARFDSANHHDIYYGPDHLHPDIKTKEVISSFLTGSPAIDYNSILQIIKEYEQTTMHNTRP